MTKRNRAAYAQRNRPPYSHIFVGRHGVPVNPIVGQIARLGSEDLNREGIGCCPAKALVHLAFVRAKSAPPLILIANLLSLKPAGSAAVDAIDFQPSDLMT